MFGNAGSVGYKDRSNLYPSSKFLHVPMNEGSGAELNWKTHNDSGVFAYGNQWHGKRAKPNGSTIIIDDTQQFDEIFTLNNLTGGLLFLFNVMYPTTKPTQQEKIFQFGSDYRASPGGIYLEVNATNLQAVITPSDNTGALSAATLKAVNAADAVVVPVAFYINMAEYFTMLSFNGRTSDAKASVLLKQIADEGKLVDGTAGNFALSFFGSTGQNGLVDGQYLNSGAGDLTVSNFWAVRFEEDKTTDVLNIIKEYNEHPYSGLESLDGI